MIDENWLIKTNVGDVEPYEKALMFYDTAEDTSGKTSAVGPNTKQLDIYGNKRYINLITNFIINNIKDPMIDNSKLLKPWGTHSWIVEGHEHSWHRLHRHGKPKVRENINLSTVLYLKVPEEGGEFYFILEKNTGTERHLIKPTVGDLLIFPWSVFHGVYPQGPGLRRTVNMDFTFTGNVGGIDRETQDWYKKKLNER